jgi:hypothetical protein
MPDPTLAAYSIVPWVRRGLSSLIASASATNYASLPVSLVVNGVAVNAPPVRMLGPGDVTSLDPRAVIRTDPQDGADAFESNYLASVELVLPDLPWMLTPAAPANGRLRPWICLIVVPNGPGATLQIQPGGCGTLKLDAPLDPRNELPNLDQIDAWAHAQVTGDNLSGLALNAALDGTSSASLARLIAPRKLEPGQKYIACVVPTYRAGVNAGLGLPVDDSDLAPAWDANTQAPFTLPVYYQFSFQTGLGGDFGSLARKIQPPSTPVVAGTRLADMSAPGFGLAPIVGVTLGVEGALRTVGGQSTAWPAGAQATYEGELRNALLPPAATDPVVAPPTYGKTRSGAALPGANTAPLWLGELNLDPRTRVAAGAGTQVVQRDQDALVASTWEQLGEIRKANQLLRQAQLARQVSLSMNARHLQTVSGDGVYLQMTAPMQGRVRIALNGVTATVRGHLDSSRVPDGAVSPAMRKLVRPRGALGRNLNVTGPSQIVDRLNLPATDAKSLVVVGPAPTPAGMVALDDVSPTVQVSAMSSAALHAASTGWTSVVAASPSAPVAPANPVTPAAPVDRDPAAHDDTTSAADATAGTNVTANLKLSDDPNAPDILKAGHTNLPPPIELPSNQAELTKMADNFRTAATSISGYLNATPQPVRPDAPPVGGSPALAPVRAQLVTKLDPENTIRTRIGVRVPLGSRTDPLQPLSISPKFPQPMYAALAELSAEWMLPGVSTVLMNSAVLLETNSKFVEAFMVGLNEELARELLWRECPADSKGTYFQTFWGATVNGAPVQDIPPIASFDPNGHLGDHMADHSSGGSLVLLIRSKLFSRYPNALVSAMPAVWSSDGKTRSLGTTRQWPIFRGAISTDIIFFGFNIDDPKGDNNPATNKPGWYFVIEEHVTEPRFGLEPDKPNAPENIWNDLSWVDFPPDQNFLNPAATVPTPSGETIAWGQNAAALAYILMRRPVRVALHGQAMLGPTGGGA